MFELTQKPDLLFPIGVILNDFVLEALDPTPIALTQVPCILVVAFLGVREPRPHHLRGLESILQMIREHD